MRAKTSLFRAGLALAVLPICQQVFGQSNPDALRIKADIATRPYRPMIDEHATSYGVDPSLVAAVITVESGGNPGAYSPAGAMGLMQLMPATCIDYGVGDPYDPYSNIRGGTAVLARHLQRFKGDLKKVLAAYNAGPGRVLDGSWTRIGETRRYVPKVLSHYYALNPGGRGFFGEGQSLPLDPAYTAAPIQATTSLRLLDSMFEAVRSARQDPSSVAENGTLHDVAATVLDALANGGLNEKKLIERSQKELKGTRFEGKPVRATVVVTADEASFGTEWARQPWAPGGFVGLAHAVDQSGKHLWLVLTVSQE